MVKILEKLRFLLFEGSEECLYLCSKLPCSVTMLVLTMIMIVRVLHNPRQLFLKDLEKQRMSASRKQGWVRLVATAHGVRLGAHPVRQLPYAHQKKEKKLREGEALGSHGSAVSEEAISDSVTVSLFLFLHRFRVWLPVFFIGFLFSTWIQCSKNR